VWRTRMRFHGPGAATVRGELADRRPIHFTAGLPGSTSAVGTLRSSGGFSSGCSGLSSFVAAGDMLPPGKLSFDARERCLPRR